MSYFTFDQEVHYLGSTREVESNQITLHIKNDNDLKKAQVGQLTAMTTTTDAWVIGMIDKVTKSASVAKLSPDLEADVDGFPEEEIANKALVTPIGALKVSDDGTYQFTRSIDHIPGVDAKCYVLTGEPLTAFFQILIQEGKTDHSIPFGRYSLAQSATAFIDGNKLFQRHAALLGSTGSGKSWAVASILEKSAQLPSSNIMVFDLHGEYKELPYIKNLHIPGPEDLGSHSEKFLYLPYWLLNAEELLSMFIDHSEHSAHNQTAIFQEKVLEAKRSYLKDHNKHEVLETFTLDSPVPFSLESVLSEMQRLDTEMVSGTRGAKKGAYHGQFTRLLRRINNRIADRRYGFLFQAPPPMHTYGAMAEMVLRMMDFTEENSQIKVIDFSEVPSDILPIIVGLVARMVYQIQFWTDMHNRNPIALICDEAHIYLPKSNGQNPISQRAIAAFEKIAKEGRKYGVSLVIVSQRPSDVSTTILSQCNNVIALRLTNGTDQATVRKLMPENFKNLLNVLPVMDIGEAMVIGDAVLLPTRIRINAPEHKPLSATIDYWSVWMQKSKTASFAESVENMRRQGRGKR